MEGHFLFQYVNMLNAKTLKKRLPQFWYGGPDLKPVTYRPTEEAHNNSHNGTNQKRRLRALEFEKGRKKEEI